MSGGEARQTEPRFAEGFWMSSLTTELAGVSANAPSSADAVIEALPGTSFDAPGGKVTIDGQTNHAIMDIHLIRANREQGWDHLGTTEQLQPVDTQAVCTLGS